MMVDFNTRNTATDEQTGQVPVCLQWQHEFYGQNPARGEKLWLRANSRF